MRRKTSRRSLDCGHVSRKVGRAGKGKYLVVILRFYPRHELEEFLQEIVVIFHPAQFAKVIEVAVYNLANVPVVNLLFVMIDVHHAQRRAYLLTCNSFIGARVGHILCL
jgi:hypothetical protein